MASLGQKFRNWLPQLDRRVWILAAGRLLSQIGVGFTLFYAPIFFVQQVGLSATLVGLGLGSQSVSGILGRVCAGSWSDSPKWGRRRVLLLSAAISAAADVVLTITYNFPTFLIGNLLLGLGIGLYWPATEAVVADLTDGEQRNEAFALVRLADTMGLGSGVVLGGVLITLTGFYRLLFVIDGITYLFFFGIVYMAVHETLRSQLETPSFIKGWTIALSDRTLLIYALVNILFTTYISQVQSTMPVYFSQFVEAGESGTGFSEATISILFTWHVVLAAVTQLPIARFIRRFRYSQALMGSALLWGIGFCLTTATGVLLGMPLVWAVLALGIMAIATVSYTPAASSLVAELAPENLRGVYMSVSSMCWAIGYFIGPPLGGWSIDQGEPFVHQFWLLAASSISLAIVILTYLDRRLKLPVQ